MRVEQVLTGITAAFVALVVMTGCSSDTETDFPVGAVDDAARSGDPAEFIDELSGSGFNALAITTVWRPGQTQPDAAEIETLRRVAAAAEDRSVRLFVIVYHAGSATTPTRPEARSAFAQYAAAVARELVSVDDVIVGNEPNLNRFWLPQFGPEGENAAAPAYLALLAETYDAVKEARSDVRVWGGATAPRGADRPDSSRHTQSPSAFIHALGVAYRQSRRDRPVMDGFVHHPYPESARVAIDLRHPNVPTIGLADYDKLVSLLGEAFDGTAQAGSDLPILYGEVGVETSIPADKALLYDGEEPVPTTSEDDQAAKYRRVLELASCQANVAGVLFFHLRDEPALSGWQSGVQFADGTPKESLAPVGSAAREAADGGLGARCGQ